MRISADRVKVSTPGTTVGLGPIADGLALGVGPRDEITVRAVAGGSQVRAIDQSPRRVPEHWLSEDEVEDFLTVRAMRAVLEAVGAPQIGIHLTYRRALPIHAGMGEAEVEILGGLFAAWTLLGKPAELNTDLLLRLGIDLGASELRMRASLDGGLLLRVPPLPSLDASPSASVLEESRWLRLPPTPELAPIALVPPVASITGPSDLRPANVTPRRHFSGASRAGALTALLTLDAGDWQEASALAEPERRDDALTPVDAYSASVSSAPGLSRERWRQMLLLATVDDALEEYRESFVPASVALIRWLRERGVAACLSGGGPAVICLWDLAEDVRRAAGEAGWAVMPLAVDSAGLRLDV